MTTHSYTTKTHKTLRSNSPHKSQPPKLLGQAREWHPTTTTPPQNQTSTTSSTKNFFTKRPQNSRASKADYTAQSEQAQP